MKQSKLSLRHMEATDDPDEIFAVLLEDGAVIVEGFITADQIERVNRELDPYNEAADPLMRNVWDFDMDLGDVAEVLVEAEDEAFVTGNTRNVTGLSSKSATFANEILTHPLYMAMCDRLLKPRCSHYVLNHSHLINVGPGAKRQPLHRDVAIWADMPGLGPESHLSLTSVVSLVDFTEENGATRVVPGSHLWDGDAYGQTGRQAQPEEIVQAVMPAGSVVFYGGWALHGAGQNRTTDTSRRGLHISYCQGWLRTEENNVLATPPAIARNLSERAQQLLGYAAYRTLGMVELRSPIDQMRDGLL
jgi:hypothetical protein